MPKYSIMESNQLKGLYLILALAFVIFLVLNECKHEKVNQTTEITNNSNIIKIAYPNWSESLAFTFLANAALQNKGYEVKLIPQEPGAIYASLAQGTQDIFLDAWLPNTHKDYWDKFGNKIEKLGESFSYGKTGLVVPLYLEINSIEELNSIANLVDGKIIGIGSGAGIHANTEKAIEQYKLNFKQITSSDPAMIASLKRSYEKKEPIIITGWKPHYMWAEYELKFLKDPKNIYPTDACVILARKNFLKERPIVANFFMNFHLDEEQLYDLMAAIKKSDNIKVAAKEWYLKNKKFIESWMPHEMRIHQ